VFVVYIVPAHDIYVLRLLFSGFSAYSLFLIFYC
jgi:hypothetical protein